MQGSTPAETNANTSAVNKPLWRRILRKVAWVLLALVVLVALLVAFIHTSWGKEFVRARAEKALQKRVNGALSIGALDYGFMFSDVELRDVRIDDLDKQPAIELGRLYVDLDRGSLLDGAPILESVAIEGVRVAIRKNEDGTSNLTGLFVPSERKGRKITIGELRVSDVGVRIERPDGSVTAVTDIGIVGSAKINSVDRQYVAELTELGASVSITRPDGTVIVVPGAKTAINATVTATSADVTLAPISVDASLTRAEKGTQIVPIRIGATSLSRKDGRIHAESAELRAGPLTIAKLSADAKLEERKLVGNQLVALEGLEIAHQELAALLGRPVLASDVAVDLRVEGPPNKLGVDGLIATDGGDLSIKGVVDATDFKKPGYDIALVGTNLETAKIIARGEDERPSLESSLTLSLKGTGIPRRPGSVANLELTTGPSRLAAKGKVGELETLKVVARADGAAIELDELTLDALGLKIAASGGLSAERSVRAKISIDGNPRTALAKLRALGIKPSRPIPVPLPSKLDLDITATGHLDGSIAVEVEPTSIPLAGGVVRLSARAELEKKDGKRALARADADVTLRRVRIEKLAKIAKRKTTLEGTLGGTVNVRVRGTNRDIDYDIRANIAEPELTVAAKGSLGARGANARAEVFSRVLGEKIATITARVPLKTRGSKRSLNPSGPLELDVDVGERSIAELKSIAGPRIAAKLDERARSGKVSVQINLRGTPSAPRGTIAVRGEAELVKLPGQTVDLDLDAKLSPSSAGGVVVAPKATIEAQGIEGPIATIGGKVTLGRLFRRGKLDREGAIGAAKLGVTVDIPERPIASLAPLRAKLAELPGDVVVSIKTSGSPKNPAFVVDGGWSGYATASGEQGAIKIDAAGTPKALTANIRLGARQQVDLKAVVDRKPNKMIVGIRANADSVRLAELLPASAAETDIEADFGELEWKMNGEVVLAKVDGAMKLDDVDLNGFLEVAGANVAIPGSSRQVRDIELRIEGDGDIIRLARLSANESDEQHQDRSIELSAEASLAGGKPKKATAAIKANKWLVFGGSMGPSDAPRASLDANIAVAADLSGDIPVIDATVHSLDFAEPNRFIRDHGLLSVAEFGDVMVLGETPTPVGKLGPVREPEEVTARKRRPMLVKLHIPDPIHLEKTPLDVNVSGELEISVKEDGVVPVGKLKVHGGQVMLFGHLHTYESGEIEFDEANPKGKVSLTFAHEMHPATLRQLSRASGGDAVKITIAGNVSKRKITLSGAGNAGMLEVMSAHQAGRSYYFTEPDLPASSSVQAPQLLQPLVLTFLATNLPHMLVLDRFSAWSDPYDSRESYGRVEHFVGESNSKNRRSRVRVVARPREVGRSGAEVQLDRLLVNSASMAIGAGVRAGSRLGGGLALFFEWTSSD